MRPIVSRLAAGEIHVLHVEEDTLQRHGAGLLIMVSVIEQAWEHYMVRRATKAMAGHTLEA